jgi:hypothetical protein
MVWDCEMSWRFSIGWLVAVLGVGVCVLAGCRKEKDIRLEIIENSCEDIIKAQHASADTKRRAQEVLDGWKNGRPDVRPILIHAGYFVGSETGHYIFAPAMSDEQFDIAGFVVREVHAEGNSEPVTIEERYPVFPGPGIGHAQLVALEERKGVTERKDDEAWQRYLDAGDEREIIYRRREYPRILISLPEPPNVVVEIWLYDFAGNESAPVRLCYGPPELEEVSDSLRVRDLQGK